MQRREFITLLGGTATLAARGRGGSGLRGGIARFRNKEIDGPHLPSLVVGARQSGALRLSQTGFVEAETALNALVTYVSSNGTDGGICDNPSSPCRTFQYALNHTIIYGEVKALDAADYGPISIDFAVNISGVEGARVIHPTGGPAINLERGAAPVSLTHLTVMGPYPRTPQRSPAVGIVINQGPITITHCTIQYFRKSTFFTTWVS